MSKTIFSLSVLIPVFNEESTIEKLLFTIDKVKFINTIKKQIIVIDDGSTDTSRSVTTSVLPKLNTKDVLLLKHSVNRGKGSAIKTALPFVKGDYVIIQDADLEYDPNQINLLLNELINGNSQVVYGTRLDRLPNTKKEERTTRFLIHYIGNRFLSLLTSILYGQWITDMETCYKLIPTYALKSITLHAKGFEFEPEITAKLLKKGYKIKEVPITTIPRTYKEGKKLHTVKDGIKAFKTLLYYRFNN